MESSRPTPGVSQPVPAERSQRWRLLVEPALLLVLVVATLGPSALLSDSLALGHPTRDLFDHLALMDHWSLSAPEQAFPDGGSLFPPDLTGMLLAAPLLALDLPRATAWNLVMATQLWLATLAGWALGRRYGAGLLAGVAFGLSPFLLGQAFSGESETIAAWPLPLVVLLLERAADRWRAGQPGTRPLVGAGLLGALGAVGAWYYGAFVTLYLAAWTLVRGRRQLRRAVLAPAAFALAIAPVAAVYATSLRAADQLFRGPTMADYLERFPRALHGMVADPGAFFGPGTPGIGHVDALGAVLLLLVLLGSLRRSAAWERARWWWGVIVVATLLALGPVLVWQGAVLTEAMPYRLLARLPLFGLMRLPHRWLLLVVLGMTVLAARGARGFSWLAAFLVWAELSWFAVPSIPSTDISPPDVVAAIDAPVLDLPPRTIGLDARGRYLVWQRVHGQPVAYTLLMQVLGPTIAAEPLLPAVAGLDSRDPIAEKIVEAEQIRLRDFAVQAAAWRAGRGDRDALHGVADRLKAMGYGQVVLHGQLLDPDDGVAIYELLRDELGEPSLQTDQAALWEL